MLAILVLAAPSARSAPLDLVQRPEIKVEYSEGKPIALHSTTAGLVAVEVLDEQDGNILFFVVARNDGPEPILFDPTQIRALARADDGEEWLSALSADDVLALASIQDARERRRLAVHAALSNLSVSRSSDVAQVLVSQQNDEEERLLAAQQAEEIALVSDGLMRMETLSPGEAVTGDVWLSTGGVAYEHLVLEVPLGGDTARFEYGDPNFVSDVCDLEKWPDGELIGWIQATSVVKPRGKTVTDFRSQSVLTEQMDFICRLPEGRVLPVRIPPVRRKGSGFWIAVVGEGDPAPSQTTTE